MSKISNIPIEKTDGPGKPPKRAAKSGSASESGATRSALVDLLKREGELSASALGLALGLTPMAARLHLYALEGEGLVAQRSVANGRGRPTKLWVLTDDAARIFPDAHQSLAVEMIKSVEELFGAEGLAKIVKKHGDMQRAQYVEKLSSAKNIAERVKRLADARNAEGYMAHAEQDGRDWLLIENHCPICSAAKACTGLCAGELKVFADVLGEDVSVKREEHILAGGRRCAYRVTAK